MARTDPAAVARRARMMRLITIVAALAGFAGAAGAQPPSDHPFELSAPGEVVATVTAGCERCDWGIAGREAVALTLSVDGTYSQHLVLTRGATPADYRVMLGALASGKHRLTIARDAAHSAPDTGPATVAAVDVKVYGPETAEFAWLSQAPILHARPGTLERFSDLPQLMYVERTPAGGYDYTVIFTNEDGGTPTDRLMATWGRTTDIESIYVVTPGAPGAAPKEEIQARDHEILPFRGNRAGRHPVLWVATENNMVSDTGPATVVRFAPAPQIISLDHVSREAAMDANPWLYAVTAAEMRREGRIDPDAAGGSGKIPDARRFAFIEACGEVADATLAFDVAVARPGADPAWYATDRGDPRFRIARGGCFRAAVPLPAGVTPQQIAGIRARAYTRPARSGEAPLAPGSGRVVLQRLNTVFMLDAAFAPMPGVLAWIGTLRVPTDAAPVSIPTAR